MSATKDAMCLFAKESGKVLAGLFYGSGDPVLEQSFEQASDSFFNTNLATCALPTSCANMIHMLSFICGGGVGNQTDIGCMNMYDLSAQKFNALFCENYYNDMSSSSDNSYGKLQLLCVVIGVISACVLIFLHHKCFSRYCSGSNEDASANIDRSTNTEAYLDLNRPRVN